MNKRIALQSVSVLTLTTIVPSALAVNAGEKHEPPRPIEVADTGISKVRAGKTVVRVALPKAGTDRQSLRLSLDGFRIEGDPRLAPEALDGILAPWKGRELSFSEYEAAIHAVAGYLREHGHPGAQVKMSRAIIGQGKVMIAIEGLTPTTSAVAETEVKPRVDVKGFKVTGLSVLAETEIQSLLAEFSGKPLTAAEMEQAAQAVADRLRAMGYPLVQAYLPRQRVDGGIVEIAVLEGRLDPASGRNGVLVEGGGVRIKPGVMEEFIARGAKPGQPLRVADLERAVLLSSDLPGVKSVNTTIEPGTETGTTRILAKVEEGRLFGASLWADNFGNHYTGEGRATGQFLLNSPSGNGEQYGLNLVASDGSTSARLSLTAPAGRNGLRLGAAYGWTTASFGDDMRTIDLTSDSKAFTLNASYPIIRSAQKNLGFSAAYDRKRYITDLTWGREDNRLINALTLGLAGDFLDGWGGQTRWSAALAGGDLDLSDHAEYQNADAQTAQTAGGFGKFNWQASRVAALSGSDRWSWMLGTSGQFASKNLDSAEKFQLGGPQGVRAYPVSEGIGDHGWLLNAELRYRLPDTVLKDAHLFGFADAGGITQFADPYNNPGTTTPALGSRPNTYSLKGVGLGANVNFGEQGSVKLMWARKLGDNPNADPASNNDSDGQNKSSRVWILGNIVF